MSGYDLNELLMMLNFHVHGILLSRNILLRMNVLFIVYYHGNFESSAACQLGIIIIGFCLEAV